MIIKVKTLFFVKLYEYGDVDVMKVLNDHIRKKGNFVMLAHPCNLYPLEIHLYVVKLGLTGVDIIFLIFTQNH